MGREEVNVWGWARDLFGGGAGSSPGCVPQDEALLMVDAQ